MNARIVPKLAAAAVICLVVAACARDNSDPPDGRSGVSVFTDALTGCQYIGWSPALLGAAALTPRMDATGKQVCKVAP
jgi:hypothetical protein